MERDKTLEEMTMSFEHRLRMSEDQREQELSALQARATRTVQKMQEDHKQEIQRLTLALEREESLTQAERKRNAELQVIINNLRSEREQRRALGRHTEEELLQQLDAARAEALKCRTEADILSQRLQLRERLFTQEKHQMEADQQARDREMERAQRAWKARLLELEVQLDAAAGRGQQASSSPRSEQSQTQSPPLPGPASAAAAQQTALGPPQTWSPGGQMTSQNPGPTAAAAMMMPMSAGGAPAAAWGPTTAAAPNNNNGQNPGSASFWGPQSTSVEPPATMAAFPQAGTASFGAVPGSGVEAAGDFGMSWPESQQPDTPPFEGRKHKKDKKEKKRHTPRDQARDGDIVEAPNFDRRYGNSGHADGPQRQQRAADVASLVGMGFNEDQVQQALVETNGDVEKAVALMLAGGGLGTPEASASPADFSQPPGGHSSHSRGGHHQQQHAGSSPNSTSMADPHAVQELVSMGFAEPQVRSALQRAHGDVEVALGYLLQNFG